jgi:hypothetical protein
MEQSAGDQGLRVEVERVPMVDEPTGEDDEDIWSVEDSEVMSVVKVEERRSGREPKPSKLGLDYIAEKSEGNSSRNRIASHTSKPSTIVRNDCDSSIAFSKGCIVRINIGIHINHNAVIGNRRADGRYGLVILDGNNNSIARGQMGIEHLTLVSRPGITTAGDSGCNGNASITGLPECVASGDDNIEGDCTGSISDAENVGSISSGDDPSIVGLSTSGILIINTGVGTDTSTSSNITIDSSNVSGDENSKPSTSTSEKGDTSMILQKGCIVRVNKGVHINRNAIIGNQQADGRYGLDIVDSHKNIVGKGKMGIEHLTLLSPPGITTASESACDESVSNAGKIQSVASDDSEGDCKVNIADIENVGSVSSGDDPSTVGLSSTSVQLINKNVGTATSGDIAIESSSISGDESSKPSTSTPEKGDTSMILQKGCIVRISKGMYSNHNAVIGNQHADGRYGFIVIDSYKNTVGKGQMGIEHLTLLSRPITTAGESDCITNGDDKSEDDCKVMIDIAVSGSEYSKPSTNTSEKGDTSIALQKGCIVRIKVGLYSNYNAILGNQNSDGRYGLEILDGDNNTISRERMKSDKFTVLNQSGLNYLKDGIVLSESTERSSRSGDDASKEGSATKQISNIGIGINTSPRSSSSSSRGSSSRANSNNTYDNDDNNPPAIISNIPTNSSSSSSSSSNVTIDPGDESNNNDSISNSNTMSSEGSEKLLYQVKNSDKYLYLRIPVGRFAGRIGRLSNRKKGTNAFLITVLKIGRETANTSTSIAESNYDLIRNNVLIITEKEKISIEKDEVIIYLVYIYR